MSNKKEHIGNTLSPEMIEKYLKGELSHEKMHEIEKLMLNSDFDAEAMEGFEEIDSDSMANDLDLLNERLSQRVKPKQKVISLWVKIAASIVLLAITTAILLTTDLFQVDQKLAQREAKEEAPAKTDEPEEAINDATENESKPGPDSLIALHEEEVTDKSAQPTVSSTETADEAREQMELSTDQEVEEPLAEPQEVEAIEYQEPEADLAISDEVIIEDVSLSRTEELSGKVAGVNVEDKRRAVSKAKKAVTREREAKSEIAVTQAAPEITASQSISGTITSAEDGTALPGINVILKGTTIGTVTDFEGNYTLEIPAGIDPVLSISFIGMSTKEIDPGNRKVVDVQMEADVMQLSEVVVTAMGVEREQRSVAYSVQTIETDDKEPYDVQPASPKGGKPAFKKYLEENARPINGMEGKVVVEFEVSPSGELINFRITKSQGEALDQEAIRLIKEGPAWDPALRNDVPEKDKVRVKVKF